MASGAIASGAFRYSGSSSKIQFDLVGGGAGVRFGVGAHDGEGVAVLEDFGIVQDGTIPAVTLVGREGDESR